jgi:hypothetical protein
MNLSRHFTLREAMASQVAVRLGIDNTPPAAAIPHLTRVAESILEPIRAHFKIPFSPTSWYRSPELNARIGGKPTSQHVTGEAVDLELPGVANLALAHWIKNNLAFDQLVLEFHDGRDPHSGWVHVSLVATACRGQDLTLLCAGAGGTSVIAGLPSNMEVAA